MYRSVQGTISNIVIAVVVAIVRGTNLDVLNSI